MTVDRSQWWVGYDLLGGRCIWGGDDRIKAMQLDVSPDAWAYLVEGLPDRGDCEDCTAIPCPAHDPDGVTIPKDQP